MSLIYLKETWVESSVTTVQKESGSDVMYGAGIEYDVGEPDNYVLRSEIEHHQVDESSYDINTASVGVVYKFE